MIDSARRNLVSQFDPIQLSPPFAFDWQIKLIHINIYN